MRPAMWRVYGGAIAVIAGIAAFIEAHSNHPVAAYTPAPRSALQAREELAGIIARGATPASGLSPTAYDLLRIGAWALVILGALTVVLGLIRYWTSAKG
jgi:hypothetical protein